MKVARILIVDDDLQHAESLADALDGERYSCQVAGSGKEGVEALEKEAFAVVLTDLRMSDLSGLEVLKQALVIRPDTAVLLITGHASIETAVDAMRSGAEDYLPKPVKLPELRSKVGRAVDRYELRTHNEELIRQNQNLRRQLDKRFGFEGILGHSPEIQRVLETLGQVASTSANVLILGESGTGKELVAQALHNNSPRADKNFVAVNSAAMSEGLIESELFGHVKGAFTGALSDKVGRIGFADGGTLFLDEVGDMPIATQAKLLRVLETREVMPVGGNKATPVDIRLIAATHQDLRSMVEQGGFREDLFYRLQVVSILLPPLRKRHGDVPLLVEHFIKEFAAQHGRDVTGITPEARSLMVRYPWPGNVRELRNAVENMVVLARETYLTVEDLPEGIRGGGSASASGGGFLLEGASLAEVEQALIQANLELMGGNRQKTAQVLGMGERTLYRKIKEYGL
ncbi:MAG: sigma-54 dependent transcriptional regulator [Planctomycetota bacterium]|nr:sigma-54 dependent transcriptional regulator [Planctomycetota bacterium]